LFLATILAMHSACAQPPELPEPPTLDNILQQLEDNLHHYDTHVPSFFCDEHVVSQVTPGSHTSDTVTDSTFRLKRTLNLDHSITFTESRDVKTVNGHPAGGGDISGPAILSGAFSGGLAIVSNSQKACMSYKLRPIRPNHPRDPYIVEFSTIATRVQPSPCLLQEDGSGRVFIDPATMQIKRMELIAPNHSLFFTGKTATGANIPPVIGTWSISIDYAPIQLGGQDFWLPTIIASSMTGHTVRTIWSFDAHYSNYHKLEVTSRIVPTTGADIP